MATRADLLEALKEAGYTGPVSYGKARLEEILAEQSQPSGVNPVPLTDIDWEGEEVRVTEWRGLKGPHRDDDDKQIHGTLVKVEGIARKKFEFIEYYRSTSQEYVTVRGPFPGRGNNRYIVPSRIRHAHNNKPVVS